MWRDPYYGPSWSEQIFKGLMLLVMLAVVARVVGELLAPVLPLIIVGSIIWLLINAVSRRR